MSNNAKEKWASLQNSDGSPHVVSFDWYDDHSGWRLEEAGPFIKEANEILALDDVEPHSVNYLSELSPLVRSLRMLHRSERIADATVRQALRIADELDLGDDTESFDAQIQYDDSIERVVELIEAWDAMHSWVWTDDVWDVTALDRFDGARKERNGLGDRWTITLTDDRIELPNGVTVYGMTPEKELEDFLEELTSTGSWMYMDVEIATTAIAVPKEVRQHVWGLAAALSENGEIELRPADVRAMQATAEQNPAEVERLTEMVNGLRSGWTGTVLELLETAVALDRETVAA